MKLHVAPVLLACMALPLFSSAGAQCAPGTSAMIVRRDFAAAKRTLDTQLRSSTRKDSVFNCLGRLALEEDGYDAAIEFFEKALEVSPRPVHHLALAMALRAQASKANMLRAAPLTARMKTELEAALAQDSTLVEAHYILLQFFAQVPPGFGGSVAKARERASTLLRINPERGHAGLGFIAEQEGDLVLAEKEYRMAVTSRPDSEPPYTAAGAFYRRREKWTEAVSMYESAVRLLPATAFPSKRAAIHYLLGNSLERAGNRARAKAEYMAALKFKPEHVEAKKALAGISQ